MHVCVFNYDLQYVEKCCPVFVVSLLPVFLGSDTRVCETSFNKRPAVTLQLQEVSGLTGEQVAG